MTDTTSSFSTVALLNGGYLVTGTDVTGQAGVCTLHSLAWDYAQELSSTTLAEAEFDAAVAEFFKPLTEAASKFTTKKKNKFATITVGEQIKGHDSVEITLDAEGILLNMLAQGKTKKLRWINGELLALA